MYEQFDVFVRQFGLQTEALLVGGIALGVLLAFFGAVSILTEKNPAAVRMAAISSSRRRSRQDRGLLRPADNGSRGVMKSFLPTDLAQRAELRRKLAQAGYSGPKAMTNFTLVRIMIGLVLPGLLVLLIVANRTPGVNLPYGLPESIAEMSYLGTFQMLTVLVATGYFGPMYWLNSRVAERQRRIQEAFPNALDLMQISVEAGLGFDSAMTRVGNELELVSPDIAFEFLSVQRQVQAGRAREVAMQEMAERTGVETVRSFANVVQQSMQFGTSMAEALTTYAHEMRLYRELAAQEMANKLPVKMSVALAALMLPALILLTIGPVVIRYVRYFGS